MIANGTVIIIIDRSLTNNSLISLLCYGVYLSVFLCDVALSVAYLSLTDCSFLMANSFLTANYPLILLCLYLFIILSVCLGIPHPLPICSYLSFYSTFISICLPICPLLILYLYLSIHLSTYPLILNISIHLLILLPCCFPV